MAIQLISSLGGLYLSEQRHATVSAPVHPSDACAAEQLLIPSFSLRKKGEIYIKKYNNWIINPRALCAHPVTPTVLDDANIDMIAFLLVSITS
jgi:hypothetical protein